MTDDRNKVPEAPAAAAVAAEAPLANGEDKLGADKPPALPEGELARKSRRIFTSSA